MSYRGFLLPVFTQETYTELAYTLVPCMSLSLESALYWEVQLVQLIIQASLCDTSTLLACVI